MNKNQDFYEYVGNVAGRDTVNQNEINNINIFTLNLIINDQTPPAIKEIIQKALTSKYAEAPD